MSSTTMMGSVSAEGKEERIFKVFAYLNTKDDFEPLKVIERVNAGAKKPVEPKTIYSYLLAIIEANAIDIRYRLRLRKPFEKSFLGALEGPYVEKGKAEYDKWQKLARKASEMPEQKKQQLTQYIITDSKYHSRQEIYDRLEQATFYLSLM